MKQKYLLIFSITAALSLTGCRSGSTDTETEALREQITQLQQQINDLEQQVSAETASNITDTPSGQSTDGTSGTPKASETGESNETLPAAAPEAETPNSSSSSATLSTTHTIEELTDMVAAYEEKINAAVPAGSAADDMEQFLSLKQEEKQIDDDLDLHEDELEYLYRNNSLSRDEYKILERELERLEDRLDAAEDKLEYTFGIDG